MNFPEFIELLEHGREIGFVYDKKKYSFTYWDTGSEYACDDKIIIKLSNRYEFIECVKNLTIDDVAISCILDKKLYDGDSLNIF